MDNLQKHHRRSTRLNGYDYSAPEAYFITICTKNRKFIFGEIVNGKMILNEYGEIARNEWLRTSQIRPNIIVDEFVVMPNHLHGILIITDSSVMLQPAPTFEQFGKPISNSIPTIIRLYKSTTVKQINQLRNTSGIPIWQRNYYEHIIRNETVLNKIREYIFYNPIKWQLDIENPQKKKYYKNISDYFISILNEKN